MNNGQAIFRGFAGAYVFYTGVNLLIGLKNGNPAFSVPVTIIWALVLLGFGGYFLYSALVGVKKGKEAAAPEVEEASSEELQEAADVEVSVPEIESDDE